MANTDSLMSYLQSRKGLIDNALDACLPSVDQEPREVHAAMRHAALSGGKRLRPLLCLAVAELGGTSPESVVNSACAIELIHAASLVLDDLPAMDDAVERRGKPSVHRAYGEATAILASMALIALAYDLVATEAQQIGDESKVSGAVGLLSGAIGTSGLVQGQYVDLKFSGETASLDEVEAAYQHKAAALFLLAVDVPAVLVDLAEETTAALRSYALNLGLAFQITDDLIDSDISPEDASKTTVATHLGSGGARDRAGSLIDQAVNALEPIGTAADTLRAFAEYVRTRTH
ncbi:MAG: polyprenyl synthetase family protein [bacterium]|nr:polyprenyl synthetase family protein [bacterium]